MRANAAWLHRAVLSIALVLCVPSLWVGLVQDDHSQMVSLCAETPPPVGHAVVLPKVDMLRVFEGP